MLELLRPRLRLQRHRRAGRGHPLDAAARADPRQPVVSRPGLLGLRTGRLPPFAGNVVRRAAGLRRGRAPARAASEPHGEPGGDAARARRRRPQRRRRAARAARRSATRFPAGGGSNIACGAHGRDEGLASAAATASRRTTTSARMRARARRRARDSVAATLDYWDDQTDVYPIDLVARRRLTVSLSGSLWGRPRGSPLEPADAERLRRRERRSQLARSTRVGATQRLVVRRARGRTAAGTTCRSRCRRPGVGRVPAELGEALEQFVVGHVAQHARRVADDDLPRAARPSSRRRPRRRTPPRRSRPRDRGSRRRRRARRGGSSAP